MESEQSPTKPHVQSEAITETASAFWHHNSFLSATVRHDELQTVASRLPSNLHTDSFEKQHEIEGLWSSYKEHGYGHFFYWLTRVLKPDVCVEIGVLQGFSLLSVASALRDNGTGIVHGFDLFEEYPYRHEEYSNVLQRIHSLDLSSRATATRKDAFQVHQQFDEVDYLHVDISNDGEVFRQVFQQWSNKVSKVILLEGGSEDRDKVDWMIKYDKAPICWELDEIRSRYVNWDIRVLEPFPSLTVAMRLD